jgi:hypothetical protein
LGKAANHEEHEGHEEKRGLARSFALTVALGISSLRILCALRALRGFNPLNDLETSP